MVTINSTNGVNAELLAYGDEVGKLLGVDIVESGRSHEQASTPPTVGFYESIVVLGSNGNYAVGETVTGSNSSATGVVVSWDSNRKLLRLKDRNANSYSANETLTGSLSGITGTMGKTDPATATVDVVGLSTSEGKYISEDGHLSETTMKIQDSLYYQDFSYVVKVGRTIDEWRDSFKKTMNPAGIYYTGPDT